jgi:hypothetical protein
MKPALLYLGVLAGGATAGAVGMSAYNAVVVGVPAEEALAELGGEEVGGEEAAPGGAELGAAEAEAEPEAPTDGAAATGEATATTADDVDSAGSEAVPIPTRATESPQPEPAVANADSLARVALNYQRLASIFSAMQPEDAAAVLEQLDDSQLEGILLAMQGRNAAPILAEMEPVRAASLSRRVLEGGR